MLDKEKKKSQANARKVNQRRKEKEVKQNKVSKTTTEIRDYDARRRKILDM